MECWVSAYERNAFISITYLRAVLGLWSGVWVCWQWFIHSSVYICIETRAAGTLQIHAGTGGRSPTLEKKCIRFTHSSEGSLRLIMGYLNLFPLVLTHPSRLFIYMCTCIENRVADIIHAVMRGWVCTQEMKHIHVKHSSEVSLRLMTRSLNLLTLVLIYPSSYICIAGTLESMHVLQVEYLHMKKEVHRSRPEFLTNYLGISVY